MEKLNLTDHKVVFCRTKDRMKSIEQVIKSGHNVHLIDIEINKEINGKIVVSIDRGESFKNIIKNNFKYLI
jgi:hypothetical protein